MTLASETLLLDGWMWPRVESVADGGIPYSSSCWSPAKSHRVGCWWNYISDIDSVVERATRSSYPAKGDKQERPGDSRREKQAELLSLLSFPSTDFLDSIKRSARSSSNWTCRVRPVLDMVHFSALSLGMLHHIPVLTLVRFFARCLAHSLTPDIKP